MTSTITEAGALAATHRTGAETDCGYRHIFYDGTCHELPPNKDYHGPEWIKWRQDHPGQWHWRPLRSVRPGPWRYPDGTKVRKAAAKQESAAARSDIGRVA
jgi:hypothetical protein